MIDTRIKYNGVNVRLVGAGFAKYQNLRILEVGIKSIKARLARGISEADGPTKPLTKRYARYKAYARRKKAVRDLDLTGRLLEEIKPRYADDRQAIADASTRLGRLKARVHSDLLRFSERDQATMLDTAQTLFGEATEQTIRIGRGPARVKALSRAVATNRATYFGRSY
jgi:hypothetical protein